MKSSKFMYQNSDFVLKFIIYVGKKKSFKIIFYSSA